MAKMGEGVAIPCPWYMLPLTSCIYQISLSILNLKNRWGNSGLQERKYKVAKVFFKSLQNALPYPFVDYFTPYMSAINADHLQPPFCSHKLCEFSVRVMGPKIWNRIKKELKCCKTIGNYTKLIYSTPSKPYPDLNAMIQVNSPKGFKRLFYLVFLFPPPHRHHISI